VRRPFILKLPLLHVKSIVPGALPYLADGVSTSPHPSSPVPVRLALANNFIDDHDTPAFARVCS
jgi:hypothetical protein